MAIPTTSKLVRRLGSRGKGHGKDNYVRIPAQNLPRPPVTPGTK